MDKNLLKNNILFGILFISFSSPLIFFIMGLPMILQLKGFDSSSIGLFQLVAIPTVIKFLLSPPIDKITFKRNHYKKWIFAIGVVYITLLFGIGYLSLEENFNMIFVVIMFTVLVSTFIDIPLNALFIKVFLKEQRISAGGYKISSFFIAGLLGGGVFLLFYNHLGWRSTFTIMATMILLSLICLFFIKESDEKIDEITVSFKTIISFFKQKNIGIWVFILAFYFAFISAVWIFMKPYLISKGISANDVAFYVGIYGGIIGAIGGVIATFVGKRFTKKQILLIFALLNIISILILIFIEEYNLSFSLLIVSITFTALSISLSSAIVFTMIMDYSRSDSLGVDYAVQSSLFSLTRIISAVIAGIMVSSFGFGGMFLFELFGIIGVVGVIYRFYKL